MVSEGTKKIVKEENFGGIILTKKKNKKKT